MKVSTGRRGTLSWALVAAAMSVSLLAASCAAPPTTPTLPSGTVDITTAPINRWVKDEPVDVTLGAFGIGTNARFEINDGSLPLGVTLDSNGLLSGAPERSGVWRAQVTAAGTLGAQTGVLVGYVVEPSDVGSAPQLHDNPVRSPFMMSVQAEDAFNNPYDRYAVYRPGNTTPQPAFVLRGSDASLPFDPLQEGPYWSPEALLSRILPWRILDFDWEAPGCVGDLRDTSRVGSPSIRRIVMEPQYSCGEHVLHSDDSSTIVVWSSLPSGDGTATHYYWFVRAEDGALLRSTSRTGLPESAGLSLSSDGARLIVSYYSFDTDTGSIYSNQLQVIGASPSEDRVFELGDDSGRQCRPTYYGFGVVPYDTALLHCQIPSVSDQVGTVDLETGNIWLSNPFPISQFGTFFPVALSPDGTQILLWRSEYELVSIFPPEARPIFDEIDVMEVGGDGSTLQKVIDNPQSKGASLIFFLDE